MRTNIIIDDNLVEKAFFYVPFIKTKKDLVNLALKEFVEVRQTKQIQEIRGLNLFADDYDYKKMRVGE